MANEAFERERARIREESPSGKSVLGVSPAARWGSVLGAAASALIAQRMGQSPVAAGALAYGGGIKGAIDRRANELSAEYKKSQMMNEQDRMAAGLVKPTASTRIEGEEVVSQQYTTAGGMKDIGRGPRFKPTTTTGKPPTPRQALKRISVIYKEIDKAKFYGEISPESRKAYDDEIAELMKYIPAKQKAALEAQMKQAATVVRTGVDKKTGKRMVEYGDGTIAPEK
ncbi:hypothetical protein LCGC14_0467110 [marine sediment metagenome]|uniref:Uncharacterized protein n=1 Tax=marine sediment metagenome TaxID=412755 RepID=A0A0F9VM61_9ZZZZ